MTEPAEIDIRAPVLRWRVRHKERLLTAIRGGEIGREEAQRIHMISDAELDDWAKMYDRYGLAGLKANWRIPPVRRTRRAGGVKIDRSTLAELEHQERSRAPGAQVGDKERSAGHLV